MADGFNPFRVESGTSATVGFAPQSGASPTAIQNSSPPGTAGFSRFVTLCFQNKICGTAESSRACWKPACSLSLNSFRAFLIIPGGLV
jgi:hypothetical protein